MGRNILRVVVSLFVASMTVSFFKLTGLASWLVFIVIYFGVSQLFYLSADKLEDGHSRPKPLPPNQPETQAPGLWDRVMQAQAKAQGRAEAPLEVQEGLFIEEGLAKTLAQAVPGVNMGVLRPTTEFKAIREDESTQPHYDARQDKLHLTKDQFSAWLELLRRHYQVEIPEEMLYDWAVNTNLAQVESWIDSHRLRS